METEKRRVFFMRSSYLNLDAEAIAASSSSFEREVLKAEMSFAVPSVPTVTSSSTRPCTPL